MPIVLKPVLQGKIVEWDDQKGYGFLQAGNRRVCLHHRDFVERRKRPAVGDLILFTLGQDPKGRTCATGAAHVHDGGQVTFPELLLVAGLLVLPGIALDRRGLDVGWIGVYALLASALSYGFHALDKRRAREKAWRIPEDGLHMTELLGGWPGAFLAQRKLRHKCSKPGYQFVFWLIVLGYQFVALDSLQNWRFSRGALHYIEQGAQRAAGANR